MPKTVIQSVSFPVEMQHFLDENPDLSLSKMLQSKIIEIQENRRQISEDNLRQKRVTQKLQEHLLIATDRVAELEEKIEKLEKCGSKRK